MAEMASDVGGAVIVVNIGLGKKGFVNRTGANMDEENLVYFADRLGFKVINKDQQYTCLRRDLELHHWKHASKNPCCENQEKCLQCLIEKKVSESSKYFLFALSSHGKIENNEFFVEFIDESKARNKRFLPLKEVVEFLKNCECLRKKVVILVIEACRSNQDTTDDTGVQSGKGPTVLPADDDQPPYIPICIPKNFLLVYSTTPNRYAYRDETNGSWFESKLKQALSDENEGEIVDLLQLLTKTAGLVSEMEADLSDKTKPTASNTETFGVTPGAKCVPCIEHRLTKPPIFKLH
ncbi:CASP7-like protein [Mya arenaria]|uniref:CASP7-like protein n=1 Tax=Mya arenaria TaxID=6604 RepID=A0ABY7DZ97_MYAAR|nr:caspase-7-like [Mya arenaria]XP_052801199.1 caspase-7-like [Mya arenaria]WAR03048.1 CASP7-like protein [Mya arenaria]